MDKPKGQTVSPLHSLQTSYALTYILMVGAVLILLNTYPILASQNLAFRSKQTALLGQASVLSSSLGVSDTLNAEGVKQVIDVLGDDTLARILVTDSAGLILYDSAGEDGLYRYALLGEIRGALSGWDVSRTVFRDGVFISQAAIPITYRSMTIGSVYLCELDAEQGALLLGLQETLRSISLVICAFVLGLSLVFSNSLTRRIGELLRAIGIVREGEYSHRVVLRGRDELSLLAEEFNSLTGRLQVTEEARRRFVSDASHELKTPLASIRLLTDSILQNPEIDPETTLEFVSDIGEEAERLTRISEKLLALTRLDAAPDPERVPVDVAAVLCQVAHMLSPLAQSEEVTLELNLAEDCLVLATDDDIYQIAFNLMENAVKYNLPGGRVMVDLMAEEDQVVLQVADTGVGIPADDLPKIFGRFYRVDKARSREAGGTGLGLSIVRDTVLQHGGSITVARREPEGTLFTVLFPRSREVAL